jgi:hypothetical protein
LAPPQHGCGLPPIPGTDVALVQPPNPYFTTGNRTAAVSAAEVRAFVAVGDSGAFALCYLQRWARGWRPVPHALRFRERVGHPRNNNKENRVMLF